MAAILNFEMIESSYGRINSKFEFSLLKLFKNELSITRIAWKLIIQYLLDFNGSHLGFRNDRNQLWMNQLQINIFHDQIDKKINFWWFWYHQNESCTFPPYIYHDIHRIQDVFFTKMLFRLLRGHFTRNHWFLAFREHICAYR